MKKFYVVFLLLAGLLGSCTKESELQDDKKTPAEGETRAGGDGRFDFAGYGYDITGAYYEAKYAKNAVVDAAALYAAEPARMNTDLSNLVYGECIAAEDIISLSQKLSVAVSAGAFGTSIKTNFNSSDDFDRKYSFAIYNHFLQTKMVEINAPLSMLQKYLTAGFKNDLANQTPEYIVNRYGTHVLRKIRLGGRIELMFRTQANSSNKSYTTESGAGFSFGKIFSTSVSSSYTQQEAAKNSDLKITYRAVGGVAGNFPTGITKLTFAQFPQGTSWPTVDISAWTRSCTKDNAVLIGVGDESDAIIPIYELVTDAAKKARLKTAVEAYLKEHAISAGPNAPNFKKDASGKVEVIIVKNSGTGRNLYVDTKLPDGYVLVGGGATVTGAPTLTSPIIKYSWPISLDTWRGSSKEAGIAQVHTLEVYAIGIKLEGLSSTQLKQYMTISWAKSSTNTAYPEAGVTLPSGYTLIGGGGAAEDTKRGNGNFMTRSVPVGENRWETRSKDHVDSDPSRMNVYAIGIKKNIPGWGELEFKTRSNTVLTGTGPHTISLDGTDGWVITCPGFESQWAGYGRLFASIYPTVDEITLISKDHRMQDSGSTTVYVREVRKKQ